MLIPTSILHQENRISWHLTPDEALLFNSIAYKKQLEGKPQVLWGWKRDKVVNGERYPESRTVYFSADLELKSDLKVYIKRSYFFLETRAKNEEIKNLSSTLNLKRRIWKDPKHEGYSRLRIEIGNPTDYDKISVARRIKGKPRLAIKPPFIVDSCQNYDISRFAPFALCAGSGLSAESGLSLLGPIHNLFDVDNIETSELIFGDKDRLPSRLSQNAEKEFRKFCQFTIDAIKAEASSSHKLLSDLYKKGIIKQIFTDNVDDLFAKVDIPYTQTRLSIFPDRFPAIFNQNVKSLLVVGIAVDRRQVIKQARKKGLKVVVINPVMGVAPHARNMDYMRKGDIFFREIAKEALPKIISASKF